MRNVLAIFMSGLALLIIGCDLLDSKKSPEKEKYSVTINVLGLSGDLTVANDTLDTLEISDDGTYTFEKSLFSGDDYKIVILNKAEGQTCKLINGQGKVKEDDIENISLFCETNLFSVGGFISGLNGNIKIAINGKEELTLLNNGAYHFNNKIAAGDSFKISVLESPKGYNCEVFNNNGVISNNDIITVNVKCTDQIVGSWNCGSGYPDVNFYDGGGFAPWQVFACFANAWRREGNNIIISRGCGDKTIYPSMPDNDHLSWSDGSTTMTCKRN